MRFGRSKPSMPSHQSSNTSSGESSRFEDTHRKERPDILSHLLARESDFRAFLRRRTSDDALAEDLLQQSFLRAIQQEHQVRHPYLAQRYRGLLSRSSSK